MDNSQASDGQPVTEQYEKEFIAEFTVRVKSYGHPERRTKALRKRIAREMGSAFLDDSTVDGMIFDRKTRDLIPHNLELQQPEVVEEEVQQVDQNEEMPGMQGQAPLPWS